MNKFKIAIGMILVVSVSVMMGCVEKFEANFNDVPVEGLVVEGDIISDSAMVFRLSKMLPLTKTEENEYLFEDYLNVDATVSVVGSDGTSWPGMPGGNGRFLVNIGTLKQNVKYHLEIEYNGDSYRSEPQTPLATTGIESLTFKQPDEEGPVSVILNTPVGSKSEKKFYMWYFEEDWEVRSEYATKHLYDPEMDKIVTYDYPFVAQGWCHTSTDEILLGSIETNVENRIANKVIRKISNTDDRLSVMYSIRIQQRDLSQAEYEYYQERSKYNSGMGGLFTPQPSELPTNISCSNSSRKIIGYVGCNMGVSYQQLFISNDDVFYEGRFDCKMGKDPEGSYLQKYNAGFQICNYEVVAGTVQIDWAKKECVDVRAKMANPRGRPFWWPNPYLY